MKTKLKRILKQSFSYIAERFSKTNAGIFFNEIIIEQALNNYKLINFRGTNLKFCVPTLLNKYRTDTFQSKEPETLEWIDNFHEGAILWDIGANIGLYSCYAAKSKNCKVFAFEPSVFNLELLTRNINTNQLSNLITIVPIPLTDKVKTSTLNMTTTKWGGALSTFGSDYSHDGKKLNSTFQYQLVGINMLDAVRKLNIPSPDYIKMDVDGIEHLILKGGADILRNVKSVLVEINEDFELQVKNSKEYLTDAGLVLKEKRQSELFENTAYSGSYNQIWIRPDYDKNNKK